MKIFISIFLFIVLSLSQGTSQELVLPSPCDLLEESDMMGLFNADKGSLTMYKDDQLQKYNRKKCFYSWDKPNSEVKVFLEFKRNPDVSLYPQRFEEDLNQFLEKGIKVSKSEKLIFKFEPMDSMGFPAIYSGNMNNEKILIFRLDNDYIISLHYQEFVDYDIGDFRPAFIDAARRLLTNLDIYRRER
ncbi:MAG TPA: hypothetical protein PK147_04195 [Saprospiraceae bacterium]|nr:hypothetical protein [Saprospiraceae bacterium]MCB9329169.1 hypothetical protein [Lewinellaceae bacterium]HPK10439.1 hypothetical protein [Saprospiraceae bacterium]HPQ21025.1 hypothetical protein [Saprospiraceae bacterium]HRX28618.1 hypothetical protein [Saprospiraceae bacterium]